MIEFEIGNGNDFIAVEGTLIDLIAETCIVIRRIYQAIRRNEPKAAAFLKSFVMQEGADGDSSIWSGKSPEIRSAESAKGGVVNLKGVEHREQAMRLVDQMLVDCGVPDQFRKSAVQRIIDEVPSEWFKR